MNYSNAFFVGVERLFSNRFRPTVLCLFLIPCVASADCKPGVFHLPALKTVPVSKVAEILHDKTGCNFIFHPSLQNKTITHPEGNYQPVSLMNQIAKKLDSQLSLARTVMVVSEKKISLSGTGKLVSLNLVDAPIKSVNQILRKLGSIEVMAESEEKKMTINLYDVPLDDVATLLELVGPNH